MVDVVHVRLHDSLSPVEDPKRLCAVLFYPKLPKITLQRVFSKISSVMSGFLRTKTLVFVQQSSKDSIAQHIAACIIMKIYSGIRKNYQPVNLAGGYA
jgi:hypothetical protein